MNQVKCLGGVSSPVPRPEKGDDTGPRPAACSAPPMQLVYQWLVKGRIKSTPAVQHGRHRSSKVRTNCRLARSRVTP